MHEVIASESARRSQKNTMGQSELSSVDSEKRKKGIEAFTYSKPAELTPAELKKVTKLTEMKSTPLEPKVPKKRFMDKINNLFGVKSKYFNGGDIE